MLLRHFANRFVIALDNRIEYIIETNLNPIRQIYQCFCLHNNSPEYSMQSEKKTFTKKITLWILWKKKKKREIEKKRRKEISTHFNDSNVNPTQYQIILDFEHALFLHFDCEVLQRYHLSSRFRRSIVWLLSAYVLLLLLSFFSLVLSHWNLTYERVPYVNLILHNRYTKNRVRYWAPFSSFHLNPFFYFHTQGFFSLFYLPSSSSSSSSSTF